MITCYMHQFIYLYISLQSVPAIPLGPYEVSKLPYNLPKNRFENIFPCKVAIIAINTLLCGLHLTMHILLQMIPPELF